MKKSKKIFISTTFANDDSKVSEVLLMCKRANLTNVELGSNHMYEKNFGKIINNYKFNFLVHNYFPIPKNSFVVNIASFSQNIRKLSLNHIKKAINFCLVSKAKLYTFHPGFIGDPIKASRKKKNYDFIWENKEVDKNYSLAFENMINSLKKIVKFAKKKNVRIAIETEGSSKKKNNFGLMQKPEEYKKLFNYFKPDDLGINLNIGHLNLASKAFNFSRQEFVNMIKPYIVALELSHNNRKQDQHLPLEKNAWYWKIINDPDFKKIYKILEFRNTKLKKIKNTIRYF